METKANYDRPYKWGMDSFKLGKKLEYCPIDPRTHANAILLWRQGWEDAKASGQCRGMELEEGIFSGCDASHGDCPVCGE